MAPPTPSRPATPKARAGDPAGRMLVRAALLAGLLWAISAGLAAGEDGRPRVAATIFPLYDIARHVAGPVVDVLLILPPGASPHTFEPTPSRVRALAGAQAVFVIGHRLVFAVFDADGAQVAGIRVGRLLTLFHVLLALAVIASISTVGIVLANALLVIPAATAKLLARSLAQMFWLAPLVGIVSVVAGLAAAYRLDLPSGPAIVVVAGLTFLTAWTAGTRRRRRTGRPPGPGSP